MSAVNASTSSVLLMILLFGCYGDKVRSIDHSSTTATVREINLIKAARRLGTNDNPRPFKTHKRVIDFHVHIWDGEHSYNEYKRHLDSTKQNVDHFGAIHIARAAQPDHTRKKNNELIELSKKFNDVIPICSVHPLDGDSALVELDRLAARKVKVIKVHPHTQNFDVQDPRMISICRRAGELGIVVLIDNANIKPGDNQMLFNLAVKLPKTKFIFAHMGGLEFRFWNILPLVRTANGFFANNIYFDVSATITLVADSPLEDEFIWTIRNVGVDHVLFGSDYPQFPLNASLRALDRLNLTDEEKDKIMYLNAFNLIFSGAR